MAHVQCLIPVTANRRELPALDSKAAWKRFFLWGNGFFSGHQTLFANLEMTNDSTIDY